jgi:drug/metabolite transporter (DMT)-like permease
VVASRAVLEPDDLRRDPATRRPLLGYAMVWTAALLFAVNGTVSKVILESGVSSLRLAELRSIGAALGLALLVALVSPRELRVSRAELPELVLLGVGGLALVQWFYFVAIDRLPIGIALLIQYLAPLLVALWVRFVVGERVRRRIWLALALTGLALVVQLWDGLVLDGLGVAASFAAAVSYAVYVLLAEREVGRRHVLSVAFYGFVFASLFWIVVQPLWTFPAERFTEDVSLLGNLASTELPAWVLAGWLVVLGTIAPFGLVVAALRHIPATRVGIVAMLEPVAAAIVAWAWLGESLSAPQLIGGAIVLAGIVLAQTAR